MSARFTTSARMIGLTLLVLVCSPVTAPFSTFDLVSLFGGATAPATTSVQSKKSPDEPAVAVSGQADLASPVDHWAALLSPTSGTPRGFASLHRPLRI